MVLSLVFKELLQSPLKSKKPNVKAKVQYKFQNNGRYKFQILKGSCLRELANDRAFLTMLKWNNQEESV